MGWKRRTIFDMKKFVCILLVLLSGCSGVVSTESAPAKLVKIAERDGIKVYRFSDLGTFYYFAVDDKGATIPAQRSIPSN